MRFTPCAFPNPARYQRPVTQRRLAAAQQAVETEKARYPLLIVDQTAEERIARMDAGFYESCRRFREMEVE